MQQTKDENLITGIVDEVIQPQLRQTIIEACRDVAEGDRNKEIEKVRSPMSGTILCMVAWYGARSQIVKQ